MTPAHEPADEPRLEETPDAADGIGPTGGAALIEHDGVANAEAPNVDQGCVYSSRCFTKERETDRFGPLEKCFPPPGRPLPLHSASYSATGRDATGTFNGGANDPPNLGAGEMPGRAT